MWLFQDYTIELEQKVQLFQEENARLRKQQQEVHYCPTSFTLICYFMSKKVQKIDVL